LEKSVCRIVLSTVLAVWGSTAFAQESKPNIVLVLMDNYGWGEPGVYGGGALRGAPTPRIDRLASEGLRLQNYNVEVSCTPSRAALLTGRHAVRTGNAALPIDTPVYGLVQWEVTLAEMLSSAGYATGMFGKWHLGHTQGRFPTDQGFDEWLGIPNSSDESFWPGNPLYEPTSDPFAGPEYVMEGRKGAEVRKLRVYDREQRPLIDAELTARAVEFMKRSADAGKPFFAFLPLTQPHMPTVPHPEFEGASSAGSYADVLVQIDAYVGRLLDALDEMGLSEETVFVFTSDNGPEFTTGWFGYSGPWRGAYTTGREGSLRVPFIVRWPGRVPAGAVSNEIVHTTDVFPTLAHLAGGKLPTDRIIDGVDQTEFLLGHQQDSLRDGFVIYVGNDIHGVKWRDWKMMFKEMDAGLDPIQEYSLPRFYNLLIDPKEEHPHEGYVAESFWARFPMSAILNEHIASLAKEKPIRPGAPDPYTPDRKRR
jgi:arylsulfatase